MYPSILLVFELFTRAIIPCIAFYQFLYKNRYHCQPSSMVLHRATAGCNITVHLRINSLIADNWVLSAFHQNERRCSECPATGLLILTCQAESFQNLSCQGRGWVGGICRVSFTRRRSRCFPKRIYYSHSYQP